MSFDCLRTMAPVTRARSNPTNSTDPAQAQIKALASNTRICRRVPRSTSENVINKPKALKSMLKSKPNATPPTDLPILGFECPQAFDTFLSSNGSTSAGIWLQLARRNSGIQSITTQEALEVALCHGWINGQGRKLPGVEGENWYLARYTPRRAKSTWSQVNVRLVERLIDERRMQPAGLAAIEAAKADGRWSRAYASPTDITEAQDFLDCLNRNENEAPKAFYEGLGKGRRYKVLMQIEICSPAARAKKIEDMVTKWLANEMVPGEKHSAGAERES